MKINRPKLDPVQFAEIITEAFPYLRRLHGEEIVVKCSGRVMADRELREDFARDVSLLRQIGISIVLVHGGGAQITELLERLGMDNRFHEGLRVTDESTMGVVEMVLSGSINKSLVGLINHFGGNAIGISGRDLGFIRARKMKHLSLFSNAEDQQNAVDLGLVGEVVNINVDLLHNLTMMKYMPVIAPIGVDDDNNCYNINADLAAARLAVALQCNKFIIMTDVDGVLDKEGKLLTDLSLSDVQQLKRDGVISQGMLPKIDAAVQAIEEGVVAVQVIDGRLKHALLLELFSDRGIGSLIRA